MKSTGFVVTSMVLASLGQATADDQPNILIVTADNLGYGDLQCYNPDSKILTPNLNALAADGVRLTDFYTASPTCTVSRACLLTGRVADRHGLKNQLSGIKGNYGPGLNATEVLMSDVLKQAGYTTGCFGKWNIGFAPGARPTERGFDEFLGHASGNIDYYRHVYNRKHDLYKGVEELRAEGQYSTDLFVDAAMDFVTRRSKTDRPWFCYLPLNAPHFPNAKNKRPGEPNVWQAPDEAFAVYGLSPEETDPYKRYAAVVTAMDSAIGRLLTCLEEAGQAEATFVFFFSDNGAFRLGRDVDIGSNHPLRSGGVTCWEGGIRVVAMARWPGHFSKGSICEEPLWSPDLMMACAKLSKTTLPQNIPFDGRNPLPILAGHFANVDRSFYFTFRSQAALRQGDWKIVREKTTGAWQLFHLKDDISEISNLAAEQPQIAADLTAEFKRWQHQITATEVAPHLEKE